MMTHSAAISHVDMVGSAVPPHVSTQHEPPRSDTAGGADPPIDRTGDAVRLLYRLGRQYAAGIRVATWPLTAVIALLAAQGQAMVITAVVVAVVTGWSAVYVRRLLCGPARWYTVVDAGVLTLLCLSTHWNVPADWLSNGESWVMAFVTFATVAYQQHTELVLGLTTAAVVTGALVAGSIAATPAGSPVDIVFMTSWSIVAALLARSLWILVRRGGVIADRVMADAEQARTAQRVATAVRADERALANALHDTAATTLLMVGTGQIQRAGGLLAAQAERDLAVLRTYGDGLPARSDLTLLLRAAVNLVPIRVDFDATGEVSLTTEVAGAIADAAGEALNNVVRHAMVDSVVVRVRGDQHTVWVEVVDQGRGFSPNEVADTRRGVRESIHGRMQRIGGRADIVSAVRNGTRVRLEWTDA
jgi:signal transduction histidine kinase